MLHRTHLAGSYGGLIPRLPANICVFTSSSDFPECYDTHVSGCPTQHSFISQPDYLIEIG